MVYDERNIKLLYISKYVEFKINNNCFEFHNYIYKTGVTMKNVPDFITFMQKGVTEQELLNYIKNKIDSENSQEILEELIRCGVVE